MATIQEQLKQFNEIVKRRGALPAPKPAPAPKPKTPQQEFLGAVSGYEPKAGKPSYTQQRQRTKGTLENDMVQVDSELGNNPKLRGIIRKVLYNARATGNYDESQLSEIRSNAVKMARSGKTANLEAFVKDTDARLRVAARVRDAQREVDNLGNPLQFIEDAGLPVKADGLTGFSKEAIMRSFLADNPDVATQDNLDLALAGLNYANPFNLTNTMATIGTGKGFNEYDQSSQTGVMISDLLASMVATGGMSEMTLPQKLAMFAGTDAPGLAYMAKRVGPQGLVQMASAPFRQDATNVERGQGLLMDLGLLSGAAGGAGMLAGRVKAPKAREPFFIPKADPTYGPDVPIDLVGMQKRRQRALPGRSPESIAESGLQGFESQTQKALPAPEKPKALNSRTAKSDLTYTDPWTGISEPKASPSGRAIQSHDNGQPYYHGHRTTVKPMEMANIDGEAWDSNLFGAGLYLTDDPGVAKRYAKAGTTKGYIAEGSKILDLNKPLPEDAAVAIEKALGLKASRDTSGAVAFKEILIDGRDSGNFDHANQVKGIISDALNRAGYDGLTHKANRRGGWREGNNGATNNVVVLFDPRKTLKNAPAKPKPAKFEPKADPNYQVGDVPDIRKGLKPVQKPSATQKEPWQMTEWRKSEDAIRTLRRLASDKRKEAAQYRKDNPVRRGKVEYDPIEKRVLPISDKHDAVYQRFLNEAAEYTRQADAIEKTKPSYIREIELGRKSKLTPIPKKLKFNYSDRSTIVGGNVAYPVINVDPRTLQALGGDSIALVPGETQALHLLKDGKSIRVIALSKSADTDGLASIKALLAGDAEPAPKSKPRPSQGTGTAKPTTEAPRLVAERQKGGGKEPWQMTREEVESLTESDFNKADKILAKQYGDLFWKVHGKTDGGATPEQVSMYKEVESASDIFREVGAKHQAAWGARAGEFEKLIKSGESYKVPQRGFMNYHKTGDIASGAYDRLTGEGGMNFVKKERFSELVDTINANGKKIEIRVEKEPAKYVKTDERDEVVRDADGKAVYLSDEELAKKGLSPWSITIGAFDGDKAIGYSGDEFGATGVYVADGYQKHGIGSRLMYEYLVRSGRLERGYRIGQMTSAGYKTVQAVHKRIVQKALAEGKIVPAEVLADYPDLEPKPKPKPAEGAQPAKAGMELSKVQDKVRTQISDRAPFWQQRAKPGGEIGPNGEHYKGGQFIARFPETIKGAKAKLEKAVESSKGDRQRNNLSDSEVVIAPHGAGTIAIPLANERGYNGPVAWNDSVTRHPATGKLWSEDDLDFYNREIAKWNALVKRVDAGEPGFRWLNDKGDGRLVVDTDVHKDYTSAERIGENYVLKGLPIPDDLVGIAKKVLPGIDIDRYQTLSKLELQPATPTKSQAVQRVTTRPMEDVNGTVVSGSRTLIDSNKYHVKWNSKDKVTELSLESLEKEVEAAVLRGEVVTLRTDLPEEVITRAGVVPLRWGAPRIIVAVDGPQRARVIRAIKRNNQPYRSWRLWKYRWDDRPDGVTAGAELLIDSGNGGYLSIDPNTASDRYKANYASAYNDAKAFLDKHGSSKLESARSKAERLFEKYPNGTDDYGAQIDAMDDVLLSRESRFDDNGTDQKFAAVQKIKDGLKKFTDIDPDGPHKAGAGWVPFTEGQIEGLKMVAEGAWELAKISGKSAMDHAFQTMKGHWSPTMQKWFEDEFKRRVAVKPERAANKPTEAVETPTKKDAVPTPAKEAKAPPTNQKVPPAQASQAYADALRKNLGLPDITKGKKTLVSMVESPRAKEVDANSASFAREWLNDTKRPITDEETAGLARAMNRLDTDTKRIQNEHMAAIERGDTDGAARLDAQLSIVLDDLNDITRVVHRTGTEWGLSGVARRLQLQKDYSTGGLTYRLSKAVKRKASAAELKEAAGHAQSVADAEIQFNKKVEEAVAARLKGMRSAPRAKGNRIFTEDRYKAAVDRINRAARGEEVRMAAGLDPQAMSDLITIVGYHVESGIRTLPELLRKAKELGLDKADERDVALATHQVLSEMDATRAQVESKKATLATLRKEVKDIVDPSILEKVNAKIAEIDSEPMANHPREYWQSRYNEVNRLLRELNRGKGIGEDVYARFEDAIQDPEVSKARIALQRRKADAEAWLNAKEWESQSGLRKAYELAVEAVNIPRVVLASGDLSAPGRQGLILLLANPKRSVAAFRDQFRAIKKAGAEKVLDGIMTEKRYDLARDAKLAIMDVTHSGLFPTEDQFISRFAGKLPIVAQSDRAYSAFLSRIRMDWFTHMVDALEKSGQPVSLKEAKEIAGFVNIATGRGNLGKFETHGNTLAKLMFSARYNWSRIQYLTGTPIWKSKSKRVQREILKTYGQTALGYAGLAAALTYGLGLSIGNDPTRGDIGRAIEGIRRYDITSGLSQYITLGARLFEGLVGNIRGDENQIKRGMSFDKGKRLIRGKLTPTLGIATDFSINQGKDMFTGKKMGFWDVARKLLLPIGVSQIIENKMEGKPMSDTAKESTAEFFGIGARTWDTLPSSKKKVPPPRKQEPAYIPY